LIRRTRERRALIGKLWSGGPRFEPGASRSRNLAVSSTETDLESFEFLSRPPESQPSHLNASGARHVGAKRLLWRTGPSSTLIYGMSRVNRERRAAETGEVVSR